MTGALVAVAGALLAWPAAHRGGARLAGSSGGVRRYLPVRSVFGSPPAVAAAAGGLAAAVSTPLVAVLAAGCAGLAAGALARQRAAAAGDARLLALAEALGVLAAELRAGRPLGDALRGAAAACPDPLTGRALLAALRGPAGRSGVAGGTEPPDLARVRAGLRLAERTGCSLAAVVAALEDDLRARHRHRAELRTATAAPRASAAVLAGLPAVGLAMGSGVGADPWAVLTTTPPGQVLLVAGVVLEVGGVAWVGRLTRRAVSQAVADAGSVAG